MLRLASHSSCRARQTESEQGDFEGDLPGLLFSHPSPDDCADKSPEFMAGIKIGPSKRDADAYKDLV
jgi:hypothetical protein